MREPLVKEEGSDADACVFITRWSLLRIDDDDDDVCVCVCFIWLWWNDRTPSASAKRTSSGGKGGRLAIRDGSNAASDVASETSSGKEDKLGTGCRFVDRSGCRIILGVEEEDEDEEDEDEDEGDEVEEEADGTLSVEEGMCKTLKNSGREARR